MSVDRNEIAEKMMEFAQEQIRSMEVVIGYLNDTTDLPDVGDRLMMSTVVLLASKMHFENAGRKLIKAMAVVSEEKVAELPPEEKNTLHIEDGDSQAPEEKDG